MQKYIFLAIIIIALVFVVIPAFQKGPMSLKLTDYNEKTAEAPIETRSKVSGVRLNQCSDDELGVRFLCDFGWVQRKVDGTMLFTINQDPAVKMKIVRIDMDILFIQQLSRDRLEALGRYGRGFVIDEVEVAGLKAIKVKAFSEADPNERMCDYYVVHDKTLYGLMFSVSYKGQWDEYKFLFEDIAGNFRFSTSSASGRVGS